MAFFNTKERKYIPRPIPPTPPYVPPVVPIPPEPGEGTTPDVPRPTYNSNINITLYQTISENNMVNKVLLNSKQFTAVFKSNTVTINPIIELETTENITQHNYCYIDVLHRYYYISDIEYIIGHIYRIHLSVDVLMSHKNGIKNMVCIVDRTQEKGKSYSDLPNENYINDTSMRTEIKEFPNIKFTDDPNIVLVVNGAYNEDANSAAGGNIGVLDGDGMGVV